MECVIQYRRGGRPLTIAYVGYFFFFFYLAILAEALFFARPGQPQDEYSACQRIADSSWMIVLGLVLLFQRDTGQRIFSQELPILRILSRGTLLFIALYLLIPFIGWNATNRLNDADIQAGASFRQNSALAMKDIQGKVLAATSISDLQRIPTVAGVLGQATNADVPKIKQRLLKALTDRQAALVRSNRDDEQNRQSIRNVQSIRLTAQSTFAFLACVWVWLRTRKLEFEIS